MKLAQEQSKLLQAMKREDFIKFCRQPKHRANMHDALMDFSLFEGGPVSFGGYCQAGLTTFDKRD